ILKALTVALASVAVAVPAATAAGNGHQDKFLAKLNEVYAWGVPSKKATVRSQRQIVNEKLAEIGASAVPSAKKPKLRPHRNVINTKLGEIGAWAVPSH